MIDFFRLSSRDLLKEFTTGILKSFTHGFVRAQRVIRLQRGGEVN